MGYILPITQFQYKDYQNRITETKQDMYDIEKPFKAFLNPKQSPDDDELIQSDSSQNKHQVVDHRSMLTTNYKIDQSIANITGKGSRFNEIV